MPPGAPPEPAAPGEILHPILEHLSAEVTRCHQLNLLHDLVKIPATEIADHFLKARQHA
jgi:hypothetical protein